MVTLAELWPYKSNRAWRSTQSASTELLEVFWASGSLCFNSHTILSSRISKAHVGAALLNEERGAVTAELLTGSAATTKPLNKKPFLCLRKSGPHSELTHNKSCPESCSAGARTYLTTALFLSFSPSLDIAAE